MKHLEISYMKTHFKVEVVQSTVFYSLKQKTIQYAKNNIFILFCNDF